MALRVVYRMRHRKMSKALGQDELGRGSGPLGRITKLRKLVTALVRHERIEAYQFQLDEARGYVELLIMNAIKYGDRHKRTMEMADYWLLEKDLVHKLFKVLAPRYRDYQTAYTKIWRLPASKGQTLNNGCLELKGNPWPPIFPRETDCSGSLTNVLLRAAHEDYAERKRTTKDHGSLLPPRKTQARPYFEKDEELLSMQLKSLKLHVDIEESSKSRSRKNRHDEGTPV